MRIEERQYLAGAGALKLGYAQMKLTHIPVGEANPDFLSLAAHRYLKGMRAIRGLLPALVCCNACCLGEWASYLGPEQMEGRKMKRDAIYPPD